MNTKLKLWFFVRDLFKPRYALIVELTRVPSLRSLVDNTNPPFRTVPVIMRVPYKRPFFMPYNVFVNGMKKDFGSQTLIFFATRLTLFDLSRSLGSANSYNVKRAVVYRPNTQETRPTEITY